MKNLLQTALITLLTVSLASAEVTLYVAPDGKDGGPGTRGAPLASLAGARDRVRQVKREKPGEPIAVLFSAGAYPMAGPVEFSAEDSGTPEAQVAYRAEPGALVRLGGGRSVGPWQPVADPAVLARLPEEARACPGGRPGGTGNQRLRHADGPRFFRGEPARRGGTVLR